MIDDLEIRDIKLKGAITEINREIRGKLSQAKIFVEDASTNNFANFEACIQSAKEVIDDAVKLYESIRVSSTREWMEPKRNQEKED